MQDHRCFRTKAHASAGTKAFTLVELLVVVAIIALLVTILMPSLGRAMELARRALCASNLHAQGQAWHVYWKEYNDRTPPLQNPRILRDGNPVSDISGQWHRLIWVGNDAAYGLGPGVKPQWLGAGVLYGQKLVGSQRIYVCPTIERNCPWPWFHEDEGWDNNLWPVSRRFCTSSTYGQRRCMQYDDPSLSAGGTMNPVDDHIMFLESGVTIVKRPGDFAFMTDRFDTPYNEGNPEKFHEDVENHYHLTAETRDKAASRRIVAFALVSDESERLEGGAFEAGPGWTGFEASFADGTARVFARLDAGAPPPDPAIPPSASLYAVWTDAASGEQDIFEA